MSSLRSNSIFPSVSVIGLGMLLLAAGCATQTTQETVKAATHPADEQGSVFGGQQPINGASVQLYAVGTTGDGSPATPLLTAPVTTNANGGFHITGLYTCPTPSSLVYIVATGGNPGGGTINSSIALMGAIGQCSTLTTSTFLQLNEVTTVAAASALSGFMTSPSTTGSGTSDAAGIAAAFTMASQFANIGSGTTPGVNVPAGAIVPVNMINTLADIVAGCINSAGGVAGDGSACGSLFSMTQPSGTTAPADTVTSLLKLAANPSLNTTALYNLASSTAPFQPQLTIPPPNFVVALSYPSTLTLSPGSLTYPSTTTYFTAPAQTVTLTNTGAAAVTLSSISLVGSNSGDFAQTNNCASAIAGNNGTCTVQIAFTPSAAGARYGYLSVSSSASTTAQTVALIGSSTAGTTVGPITLTGGPLSFGGATAGTYTTGSQNLTLSTTATRR